MAGTVFVCVIVLILRRLCILFMKVSVVGEFIMSEGSPFHSRMVRGKNECLYESVVVWYVRYFLLWEFLVYVLLVCIFVCLCL